MICTSSYIPRSIYITAVYHVCTAAPHKYKKFPPCRSIASLGYRPNPPRWACDDVFCGVDAWMACTHHACADDRFPSKPGVLLGPAWCGLLVCGGFVSKALQGVCIGVSYLAPCHFCAQGLQTRGEREVCPCVCALPDIFWISRSFLLEGEYIRHLR